MHDTPLVGEISSLIRLVEQRGLPIAFGQRLQQLDFVCRVARILELLGSLWARQGRLPGAVLGGPSGQRP